MYIFLGSMVLEGSVSWLSTAKELLVCTVWSQNVSQTADGRTLVAEDWFLLSGSMISHRGSWPPLTRATKVTEPLEPAPRGALPSPLAVLQGVDASLTMSLL